MAFQPTALRSIPLFANIPDEHLTQLVGAFQRRSLAAGEVLFSPGETAADFVLLTEGAIEVRQGDERIVVRPVAPVGEVGALAGLRRSTAAVAAAPSEVLTIPTSELVAFFEKNGDIGFRFHHNLLAILADKLERDRIRIDEMRANVIRTQKTMKHMRDAILEAEDTPLHRTMFEDLDALIEANRRGHYLVDVVRALPTRVRLDDGTRDVIRMSNERVHVASGPGTLTAGAEFTAVLVLGDAEIPVTGTVDEVDSARAVLALDALIDEYTAVLEQHLWKLQLLDVVL